MPDSGHATCCAGNGAEALGIYNAQGADVVVSDWMMPDLDGAHSADVFGPGWIRPTPISSC